jgi:hypothetical protein
MVTHYSGVSLYAKNENILRKRRNSKMRSVFHYKKTLREEGLNHNPIHTLKRHVFLEKRKSWSWNYESMGRGAGRGRQTKQNHCRSPQVARNYRFLNLFPPGPASACEDTHTAQFVMAGCSLSPVGVQLLEGSIKDILSSEF